MTEKMTAIAQLSLRRRAVLFFALLLALSCSTRAPQTDPAPTEAVAAKAPSSELEVKVVPATGASEKVKKSLPLEETTVGNFKNETIPTSTLVPLEEVSPASGSQEAVTNGPVESIELAIPSPKLAAPHTAKKGVAPSTALTWLKNGNARFLKRTFRNDGQSIKDVRRLSEGQTPHTIVLSCSDSRVPPEIVFDQKLGEIFVVRTAGGSLDTAGLGSIEYAVQHLGARLILVMGHTSCGAVKAAVETMGGKDAGSPHLNKLVADIQPRLKSLSGNAPHSKNYEDESWANTRGVAGDLSARSAILSDAIQSGNLEIRTALYDLSTGKVAFD